MGGQVEEALPVVQVDIDAALAEVDVVEDVDQGFLDPAHPEVCLEERDVFHELAAFHSDIWCGTATYYSTLPEFLQDAAGEGACQRRRDRLQWSLRAGGP